MIVRMLYSLACSQTQSSEDELVYESIHDHLQLLHRSLFSLAQQTSAVLGYHFIVRALISTRHSAPQIQKSWNHTALHN
jgi:hypothetical protein